MEAVQTVTLFVEFVGKVAESSVWLTGHTFTGNTKSQWKPGAQLNQVDGDIRFGVDTVRADHFAKKRECLVGGQQVKGHSGCSFTDGQSGHSAPAGHQNGTSRDSGEQRSDLFGGSGTVEDDQDTLSAE